MDGSAFDRLSRAFVRVGTRRGLLGLLSGLPLVGFLNRNDVAEARPGRKTHQHHAHHQHRHAAPQRHTDQRHDLQSEACIPTGQRCPAKKPRGKHAKKLGCSHCCQGSFVTETSGKKICGCQPTGGACRTDTAASCCSGFCDGATCTAAPCSAAHPCPACQTCGADGVCGPVADGTACGTGHVCTQGDVCQDGVCVAGSALPDGTACGNGQVCCGGGCLSGTCCTNADCAGTTPICGTSHTCVACTSSSQCPPTTLCDASGACLACDVTCPSSPCGNLVQAAITTHPSQTVFRVCAGTYVGDLTIGRDLTLLGAGEGADDATNTILHGTGSASVVRITNIFPSSHYPDVTLRDLRITGGGGPHHYGGGVFHGGNVLTMTDCTVTGNAAVLPGGGILQNSDAVLTRCTITANQATSGGGGIATGGQTTLTDCVVAGNTTEGDQGGGGILVYGGSLTLNTTRVGGPTPAEANHANGDTPGGGIYRYHGTVMTNASVVCGNVPDQCNFSDAACQPTCPS